MGLNRIGRLLVPRVVILTLHSLFVEGVAARLRQHLPAHEIQTVDAGKPEAMSQVIAAQPAFVILDASDHGVERLCSLSTLLSTLTALTVLRLDPEHDHMQVVTSKQQAVGQVRDLVEIIGSPA